MKECVIFSVCGWERWGRERSRQTIALHGEIDLVPSFFVGEGGGAVGSCVPYVAFTY